MKIYTLSIGQGQFAVVVGATEAIIVDTCISNAATINVKGALANILGGKNLVGLMITGFDADHFNEMGISIVLNKYRPDWIMYPRYFKESKAANAGFLAINKFSNAKDVTRVSVDLDDNNKRLYNSLTKDFTVEVFSPHKEDMDSSNNSSLVCKITERATGASYLVTGDTEGSRWDSIVRIFGNNLKSDVLDAPHHGSKNGITKGALALIKPHTVLISAGIDNAYGHPDAEAIALYRNYANQVYSTNWGDGGQSLLTTTDSNGVKSVKFTY